MIARNNREESAAAAVRDSRIVSKLLLACLASLAVILIPGCEKRDSLVLPPGYEAVQKELLTNGEFRHYPELDPTGKWLVFARNRWLGLEYFLMDASSGSVQTLTTNVPSAYNSLAKLFAWSSDGKWLAWAESGKSGALWTVKLREMTTGAEHATGLDVGLTDMVWLGEGELAVSYAGWLLPVMLQSGRWEPDYSRRIRLTGGPRPGRSEGNRRPDMDTKTLTAFGSQKVAYAFDGNIWVADLARKSIAALTAWSGGEMRWLDYSSQRDEFLFCVSGSGAEAKSQLMVWSPGWGTNVPARRLGSPDVSILKGSWIKGGYAFVEDFDEVARLRLEYDSGKSAMLFTNGSIWSYQTSKGGKTLAAIASDAMEPMGLWQVDVVAEPATTTHLLAQGGRATRTETHRFEKGAVESCYQAFLPDKTQPGDLCPAVVVFAYARSWSELVRVLPLLDMIVIVPGCGGDSRKMGDLTGAELRAIVEDAAAKLPLDTNRIYLEGASARTHSVKQLLEAEPELLRGAIMVSPLANSFPDLSGVRKGPTEMMFIVGSLDENRSATQDYVKQANRSGVRAWDWVVPDMAHAATTTRELDQIIQAVAAFVNRSAAPKDVR